MKKYDIFISYRRDGGAETAKMIRDSLTEKGYRVFLDIESLRSGQFNAELYRVIENSKDVLLILPEHGLDRCVDADDWVRLEIEHAKRCNKNIIPIFLKNFQFPSVLPESIQFITTQNGISANTDYYDAFIDHLVDFLESKHFLPKSKRWIPAVISILLVISIVLGGYKITHLYPITHKQKNLVSELITYMMPNLTRFDLATTNYQSTLEKASAYLSDDSLYTAYDIVDIMDSSMDQLNSYINELEEMPKSLRTGLEESPFDTGNLDSFIPLLTDYINFYIDRELFIRNYIVTLYYLEDEDLKQAETKILINMTERDIKTGDYFAENMFYCINEVVRPVNVDSALYDLKRDYMPILTSIYSKRLDFCTDLDTIRAKQENIQKQLEKLSDEDQNDINLLTQYAENH